MRRLNPNSTRTALWAATLMLMLYAMPQTWQRAIWNATFGRIWKQTVASRLRDLRSPVMARLGNPETPEKLLLAVYKAERELDVFTEDKEGNLRFLKYYPVLAASGSRGPKLREGDRQVPEGKYAIESLHPNSLFHLALKVAYPSEEDKRCAKLDGRDAGTLGSNIMIHGKGGSAGCIALSDRDIEEIFVLAALTGVENVTLLIFPWDFKLHGVPEVESPAWLKERYQMLDEAHKTLPQ